MKKEFRANGKLMISGEYFVLDGATSLAVPTRYGQTMKVEERNDENIHWTSLDKSGSAWFKAIFQLDQNAKKHSDPVEDRLIHILSSAREMNPEFLRQGADVTVRVDFDLKWGLGSSSTLISLVAQWASVDAYDLQFSCFGGSGYDIACATANGPLLYQKLPQPQAIPAAFNPPFVDQLYFVYLGKKQNSRDGIDHYRALEIDKPTVITQLDKITNDLLTSTVLSDFAALSDQHETIISGALSLPKVKQLHFEDYWGSCKSLGAWGGDFVLCTSSRSKEDTMAYFKEKGHSVCIPYREMIL